MIENVRVSEKAKIQLITLKRRTGIQNWNTLCRWALCLSLAEDTKPPHEVIPSDSSVEMTWKTFTGGLEDEYLGLVLQRAIIDEIQPTKEAISGYFRLHLHRGISYMFAGRCENLIVLISQISIHSQIMNINDEDRTSLSSIDALAGSFPR